MPIANRRVASLLDPEERLAGTLDLPEEPPLQGRSALPDPAPRFVMDAARKGGDLVRSGLSAIGIDSPRGPARPPDQETVSTVVRQALNEGTSAASANVGRKQEERQRDAATFAVGTVSGHAQNVTTPQKPSAAVPRKTPSKAAAPAPASPKAPTEPGYYDRVKAVRIGGRTVMADPGQARQIASSPGGEWTTYDAAMKRRPVSGMVQGSAGTAFIRPDEAGGIPGPIDERRYSEKLAGLELEMPQPDLTRSGEVIASTPGYVESGGRVAGPRSRTSTLSGLEQALSRREWLEGRRRAEEGRELGEDELGARRAEIASRTRLAEMDPLAQSRIEAQGRYGDQMLENDFEIEARTVALRVYQSYLPQIQQAQRAAETAPSEGERAAMRERVVQLQRQARDQANLALGKMLMDEKMNPLAALLGGGMPLATTPEPAR